MPFAITWTEELIVEWLLLNDYIVLQNVRLRFGRHGGVEEVNVVGIKL
jgi:hypothetical protein